MSPEPEVMHREGHDALWEYFGLGRPTFLTIPRVMLHAMPDEWQGKLAALLAEYEAAFPNQPDISTRVQITKDGKLIPTPAWMVNYRHPDHAALDAMRPEPSPEMTPQEAANRLTRRFLTLPCYKQHRVYVAMKFTPEPGRESDDAIHLDLFKSMGKDRSKLAELWDAVEAQYPDPVKNPYR